MAKEPIILSNEIAPMPALVRAGMDTLPAAILAHGERTARQPIYGNKEGPPRRLGVFGPTRRLSPR
jgi:hypothetical protein